MFLLSKYLHIEKEGFRRFASMVMLLVLSLLTLQHIVVPFSSNIISYAAPVSYQNPILLKN
jgi:hypothetical protein